MNIHVQILSSVVTVTHPYTPLSTSDVELNVVDCLVQVLRLQDTWDFYWHTTPVSAGCRSCRHQRVI